MSRRQTYQMTYRDALRLTASYRHTEALKTRGFRPWTGFVAAMGQVVAGVLWLVVLSLSPLGILPFAQGITEGLPAHILGPVAWVLFATGALLGVAQLVKLMRRRRALDPITLARRMEALHILLAWMEPHALPDSRVLIRAPDPNTLTVSLTLTHNRRLSMRWTQDDAGEERLGLVLDTLQFPLQPWRLIVRDLPDLGDLDVHLHDDLHRLEIPNALERDAPDHLGSLGFALARVFSTQGLAQRQPPGMAPGVWSARHAATPPEPIDPARLPLRAQLSAPPQPAPTLAPMPRAVAWTHALGQLVGGAVWIAVWTAVLQSSFGVLVATVGAFAPNASNDLSQWGLWVAFFTAAVLVLAGHKQARALRGFPGMPRLRTLAPDRIRPEATQPPGDVLTLDAAHRLTLGHAAIDLSRPFKLTCTRSADPNMSLLGVTLHQDDQQLRFRAALTLHADDAAFDRLDTDAPIARADDLHSWIWPALRHAAAVHGLAPLPALVSAQDAASTAAQAVPVTAQHRARATTPP